MAPYPTPEEIADHVRKVGAEGGGLIDHMREDVDVEIMGYEHDHTGHFHSREAYAKEAFALFDWMDWSTARIEIMHVIGGGESSWACVEAKTHGKAEKGKLVHFHWVFIANYDKEGMITEGRLYTDSAHAEDHRDHHENN